MSCFDCLYGLPAMPFRPFVPNYYTIFFIFVNKKQGGFSLFLPVFLADSLAFINTCLQFCGILFAFFLSAGEKAGENCWIVGIMCITTLKLWITFFDLCNNSAFFAEQNALCVDKSGLSTALLHIVDNSFKLLLNLWYIAEKIFHEKLVIFGCGWYNTKCKRF